MGELRPGGERDPGPVCRGKGESQREGEREKRSERERTRERERTVLDLDGCLEDEKEEEGGVSGVIPHPNPET